VKANHSRKKRPEVPNPAGKRGMPVSLYPLSFADAVSGLAQVQMPAKEASEKPQAKVARRNLAKIRKAAKP